MTERTLPRGSASSRRPGTAPAPRPRASPVAVSRPAVASRAAGRLPIHVAVAIGVTAEPLRRLPRRRLRHCRRAPTPGSRPSAPRRPPPSTPCARANDRSRGRAGAVERRLLRRLGDVPADRRRHRRPRGRPRVAGEAGRDRRGLGRLAPRADLLAPAGRLVAAVSAARAGDQRVHDGIRQALLTDLPRPTRPGRRAARSRAAGRPVRAAGDGLAASTDDRRRHGRAGRSGWATVSGAIEELEEVLSRFRPSADLVALNGRAGDPACRTGPPAALRRPGRGRARLAQDRWRVRPAGPRRSRAARLSRRGRPGAEVGASAGETPAAARGPGSRRRAPRSAMAAGSIVTRGPVRSRSPPPSTSAASARAWRFAGGAILLPALPEIASGAHAVGNAVAADGAADAPHAGALLEAGGDLVARGAAPQPGPWLIGIESPLVDEEIAVVWAGRRRRLHLVDRRPRVDDGRRTGRPPPAGPADRASRVAPGSLSVTVAATDPAGPRSGRRRSSSRASRGIAPRARALGLAAWWIAEDGAMEMTAAARARTAWVAGEA